MIVDVIKFKGHGSFTDHFAGFDCIKPINVIIGRNNSGKSHLIDLVEQMCSEKIVRDGWTASCRGVLTEYDLKMVFPPNHSGGDLPGEHWANTGKWLLGATIEWTSTKSGSASVESLPKIDQFNGRDKQIVSATLRRLSVSVASARSVMSQKAFRRLRAERDIVPEKQSNEILLGDGGHRATNIIRRCLRSTSPPFSADLIRESLLNGLNEIFGDDGQFQEIEVGEHDAVDSIDQVISEIYLTEELKGRVQLSRSGSGLKTILLVLLNLLVVPILDNQNASESVYAFEELENNLHPSILRRLLKYLESFAMKHSSKIFLTTHSSVTLDVFGGSPNAQIVRVIHDGKSARTETVSDYFSHHHIISDLGVKPSDVLQANGVIWLEGPSDRIYLNHWIDLISDGQLREGKDYQCAFFGGSLLGRSQFAEPNSTDTEFANLLRLNPNVFVVADSDRTSKKARLKSRVERIVLELKKVPGAKHWLTAGKEIENYIPGEVIGLAFEGTSPPDPDQFEQFFPTDSGKKPSYVGTRLRRKSMDKVDLAFKCVPHMTQENMAGRFDWSAKMRELLECIEAWNK